MIIFLEKEQLGQHTEHTPTRCARIEVSIKGETSANQLFELIVDLDHDTVVRKEHVEGKHSYIDTDYMKAVEKACLANEEVQAEIRSLDLPTGATVVVEPWAYATDGMNDMTDRVSMVGHFMPYNSLSAVLTWNSVGFT